MSKKYKKVPRTYIPVDAVPGMPPEELINRTQWLRETMVKRYCKFASAEDRKDAMQQAALVLLEQRCKFNPAFGMSFEGWVRQKLAGVLIQLRLKQELSVTIPERVSYSPTFVRPTQTSIDALEPVYGKGLICVDTAITDNERGLVIGGLHRRLLERLRCLPDDDRVAVENYIGASPKMKQRLRHDRAREICAGLTAEFLSEYADATE